MCTHAHGRQRFAHLVQRRSSPTSKDIDFILNILLFFTAPRKKIVQAEKLTVKMTWQNEVAGCRYEMKGVLGVGRRKRVGSSREPAKHSDVFLLPSCSCTSTAIITFTLLLHCCITSSIILDTLQSLIYKLLCRARPDRLPQVLQFLYPILPPLRV